MGVENLRAITMKKILVVDNDRITLQLISRFLKNKGYDVVTAESGIRALDILRSYEPDAIFIDLVMPNIDGKQLCKIIRCRKEFDNIYIIILSAISAEEWVDICHMGADACIAKGPFNEMSRHIIAALDNPEVISERCSTGEVLGINDVYPRNITKELLLVKRHFEIILDKMSEGIIEINSDGRIIFANAAILSMINIPVEILIGSLFVDIFSGDEHARVSELMKKMDQKGKKITDESPLRINDYYITLEILSLDEDDSNSLIILRDISEQKRAESALVKNEKLQGALEMAGAISYELNQPIQAIMGYSDLLMLDMSPDHSVYGVIKNISEQVQKIGTITYKLSNLTRYETKDFLNSKIIDIDKSSTKT